MYSKALQAQRQGYRHRHLCIVCQVSAAFDACARLGQVWLPTDKNMAGCDNCSFWVHDHCDPAASVALHAPSDIPFYCAPCKRQAEAHAKLTALRQAEAQLRSAQPRRPRSAYHLFSMELNKCGPFSS